MFRKVLHNDVDVALVEGAPLNHNESMMLVSLGPKLGNNADVALLDPHAANFSCNTGTHNIVGHNRPSDARTFARFRSDVRGGTASRRCEERG